MAVNIPTLEELEDQILNLYATEFGISVAELGDTFVVQSKVDAALLYQFYLTLGQVELNVFPDLSDEDTLLRYGQGLLGRLPAPAVAGVYEIEVTGNIGATITSGTTFKSNDDSNSPGYLFVVDLDFTLASTTDTLQVRSLTAGLEAKLNIGNKLTATQPLLNVDDEAEVLTIIENAAEGELIDSYREDTLTALRLEPQGGSPSDYRLWALDVPEVRTVYPYLKLNSILSVDIYVEATPENSETIIGVPSQSILDAVYKKPSGTDPETGAIVYNEAEDRGRRPLGVTNISSLPVAPISVDLEFTDLTNLAAKDSIQEAVENYLYTVRPFVAGAESILNKNDVLTVGQLISIVVTVLDDLGGTFSDLNMRVDSNIINTYTFNFGNYPFLRNINNNGLPI
jgi:uncharacterized phage protein gp47/JayE